MSELAYAEGIITSALVTSAKEKIADRKTIVYETLIDPTVIRILGEKNKNKLFKKFLFRLNSPEEIEFVSIEKYYEPYIVVSGKYFIDYYRKCAYTIKVNREAKEVILFNKTFTPEQTSNLHLTESSIRLEGEERLVKEPKAFLTLNKNGQDSKVNEIPSAPSEKNPQELVKSSKMLEIAPNMDVEVIRKRIAQRPNDISRILNEMFEIDERSVIYTPRFKLKYKCQRIGKEAYLEFDGVTSKLIKQNENIFSKTRNVVKSRLENLLNATKKLIKPITAPRP